ncbi:transcriptional regulator [Altererythrobacter salegens]|uniref:Transcriptional regulator n=1 Tax=Croceibacterium salegens TaxID=1737568 RepID=A0A6I4SZ02_9SPHN|nr:helix-turn-helix domain-containing protein [Croceibacterium salegens]MXO61073.1 transcriptional regulator [Croceibacterium salegens]
MGHLHENLREVVECGLPGALEVIGDRWSFMILRAGFNGIRHFDSFQSELGIARNILSNRLHKLVENGIFSREPCEHDKRKVEYRLTAKAIDLLPALIALRQWGEKYTSKVPSNLVLVDARDRKAIEPVRLHAHDGRPLAYSDLDWEEADKVASTDRGASGECC